MISMNKFLDGIEPFETDFYRKDWRLKLNSNENLYGISDLIFNVIKSINKEDISYYPAYGKLVDKLAKIYELSKDNILLTNGCDEALKIIMETFIEEDDELLTYNPTFSMPLLYAKLNGGKIKQIEYDENFVFNKDKIIENVSSKTKIIYIATPNNPTGDLVRPSIVEILAQKLPNVLLVIDCTYINFAQGVVIEDYIDLMKKFDNIVIVKSFSKDYALAGLRIGFALSNENFIANMKKVTSPYNVNIIAMNCAISALNDEKRLNEIKELNENARCELFKGLKNLGFEPFESHGNFILCDFKSYCDFCYEKLKKNGIIVQNFPKNSPISTCLRITVPKVSGVKLILELLKTKDVLIFDVDGVIFDVSKSYLMAIKETFEYFSKKEIEISEIQEVKNQGGMNCDWDVVQFLLKKYGYNIEIAEIISVFQNLFFNPNDKSKTKKYLIDEEKLLISPEIFEKLIQKYDLVVFTGRLKEETKYSFDKFDIDKYFYYYVTSDDLPKNMLKPHSKGVFEILEHCPHNDIKYLGDSVDDIISGNGANVETIGVVSPDSDFGVMVNNFKHLGANYILDDIKKVVEFLKDIN